jgi:hypothetical protein
MHGQQNIKFTDIIIMEFQQENLFAWLHYTSLFFVVWKMFARKPDAYSAALKTRTAYLFIQPWYFSRRLEQM